MGKQPGQSLHLQVVMVFDLMLQDLESNVGKLEGNVGNHVVKVVVAVLVTWQHRHDHSPPA